MLRKLSFVTASIVAFVFVFVSIAHACSGLASMNSTMQSRMNMGASDNSPCSNEKNLDICKSVRDSMLSVKPSLPAPEQTVTPLQLLIESPFVPVSTPITRVTEVSFHPVFKLPLNLSYLVLRI